MKLADIGLLLVAATSCCYYLLLLLAATTVHTRTHIRTYTHTHIRTYTASGVPKQLKFRVLVIDLELTLSGPSADLLRFKSKSDVVRLL